MRRWGSSVDAGIHGVGAVAQEDRPTAISMTLFAAKCQFRSAGPSGPIYACKDPKKQVERQGSAEDQNA